MILLSILVSGFLSLAAPHKMSQVLMPSQQRLKEFPLVTLRTHRTTLQPSDLASPKHLINRDPRALSWAFNLRYEGQMQPIAPERRELMEFIVKMSPQLKGVYTYEILVSDGEETFWLPIQNGTLAFFKRDQIKKGERFYAQTRYFGSYYKEVPRQFFIMLGYRKTLAFR